ncbi:MAG: hypothetical protein Q9217_000191 [Psora testacea]
MPATTYRPRHWLDSYAHFVRSNASQVTQVESALRSLEYIIPGRFHETPITAEALHTTLTLLTSFHTYLLSPSIHDPNHHASPQTRYERWAGGKSRFYRRAGAVLRTVQYTQLLIEMFAKRAGEKVRWRVVVLLEVVKALCRFLMLRLTGSRAVIGSEMGAEGQERKIEEGVTENLEVMEGLNGNAAPNGTIDGEWKMPRTGMNLPPLPSPDLGQSITTFLEKRVVTAEDIKSAQRLVHKLRSVQGQAAEVMWILRPVIYALALQRVQGNKRDWRPWLVGIGLEVASRHLSKKDIKDSVIGGLTGMSSVEREELKRRGWSMAWWGMRGAFYDSVTGPWVKGVAGRLKGKLLLDMVGTVTEDYDWLWEEYYFSTATV